MNREEAKQYVKAHLEEYLRSRGINPRHNFRCLNPQHYDANPSMSIDYKSKSGLHCKCFSCGAYYDTFDLIAMDYHLTDNAEIFKKGYELFHLTIDGQPEDNATMREELYQNHDKTERSTNMNEDGQRVDFTNIVQKAHERLLENKQAIDYLQGRGLSMETIKKYKLGYDKAGYNHFLQDYPAYQSKSPKAAFYRLILPYQDSEGKYTYFLTEINNRAQVDKYNGKYRKISNLTAQLFNERYLKNPPKVVFICEGIYDALSVEEAGGKAIAFVGTAHERFLELCEKYKPHTTFIISLDNDGAGQQAIERVKAGLDALRIPYVVKTAQNGKDFNEDLQKDREAFTAYIQQVEKEAGKTEKERYLETSVAYQLQNFINNIVKNEKAYPTGFESIDKILDGGLYTGLYTIGAISSLGKTTFCLQLVSNLAAAGNDVIIFSLEMSSSELIAKSVSRHTIIEDLKQYQTTVHAKTMREITTGSRYSTYSRAERKLIEDAITAYSGYANHIYIHEGVGDIGVDEIRAAVDKHIRLTGKRPIVLVDYIQILSSFSDRATDKQKTDKNVLELKRISRDYSIPLIGISSFNRDSYTQPVTMSAFKESGAVEYSSDVLIALQYEGMDYQEDESDKARQRRIRQLLKDQIIKGNKGEAQSIQVKILKSKNGAKGETTLDYYPMFNLYTEKQRTGIDSSLSSDEWTHVE